MEVKKQFGEQNEEFSQEKLAHEAEIRFDQKTVRESNRRYKSWSKEKIEELKKEMKTIAMKIAELKDRPVSDREVQELVRDYHRHMENYYHVTQEIFIGLAELYSIDPTFADYFEKISIGLTDFLSQAMQYYCNTEFKELSTSNI